MSLHFGVAPASMIQRDKQDDLPQAKNATIIENSVDRWLMVVLQVEGWLNLVIQLGKYTAG